MTTFWQHTHHIVHHMWFRDRKEDKLYINDTVVRIRAGILLMIPIYMIVVLHDIVFGSTWIVDGNTAVDTYDTDWEDRIVYSVEAVKRTYEYSVQTTVLFYGLFEMLAGMFVVTSRFSPTIWIASLLSYGHPHVWKPLAPKRFAWSVGMAFIVTCLIFFNPTVFATWVNALFSTDVLPTTAAYIPYQVALSALLLCFSFMWLEAILGFCVGCKIHALLVKIGLIKEACDECNHIDWDAIRQRNEQKQTDQR